MNAYYVKKRYDISVSEWTPIVAPIDANYFGLKNSDGSIALLRTDKNDDQTEDTLPAFAQEGITTGPNLSFLSGGPARFPQGSTAVWVKATTGVGPVIVTWVL